MKFFKVNTKFVEWEILGSKDLTAAKKQLPPVGLNLMTIKSGDYYWFESLMLIPLC